MHTIQGINKKLFSVMFFIAMSIGTFQVLSVDACAADNASFKSIKVSNNTVKAGESFNVEVTFENGSAIIDNVTVTWLSETGREMYADIERNNITSKLQTTVNVGNFAEAGKWRCVWIGYIDSKGNYGSVDEKTDLTAGNITIDSKTPDITEPEFLGIKVTPKTLKPGEIISVSITAKDDISGIDYGFVTWNKDSWSINCSLTYNEKKKLLEGKAIIPDEVGEGKIEVTGLNVSDLAGNSFSYSLDSRIIGNDEDLGDDTVFFESQFDEEDTETTGLDLSAATLIIKGRIARELITPPVIISPVSSSQIPFAVVDQDAKTPGLQFDVQGFAVPGYKVRLISGGKTIAESVADFTGVWKIHMTTLKPLSSIYAISVLPNGSTSPSYATVTRAQIAKLLVKISGYELNADYINAFNDVSSTNLFVHYIETAKDLGISDPKGAELFKPTSPLSRELFTNWVLFVYESMQETDEALSVAPVTSGNTEYKRYFSDVMQQSAFSTAIERGYENGWIAGNPDKTFHPEESLSASLTIKGIPDIKMLDVPDDSWYAGYMFDIVAAGIINGTGSNLFRPEANLTRGEFAKMLCLLKNWKPSMKPSIENTSSSSSEGESHWANSYMRTLRDNGVIDDESADTISPDRPITRAETAKMAVLAAGFKSDTTQELNPDTIDHWAEQYILTAKKHSIISGYPDGMFRPDDQITRAEAVKIIWKLRS